MILRMKSGREVIFLNQKTLQGLYNFTFLILYILCTILFFWFSSENVCTISYPTILSNYLLRQVIMSRLHSS